MQEIITLIMINRAHIQCPTAARIISQRVFWLLL